MIINLLLLVCVLLLLLGIITTRLTESRTQRLREAGLYPMDGEETAEDVDRLLHHGHKIEAIKVYRVLHRVGLKEAKKAVEQRQREIGLG